MTDVTLPAARWPSPDQGGSTWVGWPSPFPGSTTPATPRWPQWPRLAAGVAFDDAATALARFAGVARRFEFRGDAAGVTFVDDYAHLPSEVEAALAAARIGAWQRIVAVFQPHRYSRTAALSSDFGRAFADADVVVVTDVYGAGEAPDPRGLGKAGGRRRHPGRAAQAGRLRARSDRSSGPGGRAADGRRPVLHAWAQAT